jgi:hypothetical protein
VDQKTSYGFVSAAQAHNRQTGGTQQTTCTRHIHWLQPGCNDGSHDVQRRREQCTIKATDEARLCTRAAATRTGDCRAAGLHTAVHCSVHMLQPCCCVRPLVLLRECGRRRIGFPFPFPVLFWGGSIGCSVVLRRSTALQKSRMVRSPPTRPALCWTAVPFAIPSTMKWTDPHGVVVTYPPSSLPAPPHARTCTHIHSCKAAPLCISMQGCRYPCDARYRRRRICSPPARAAAAVGPPRRVTPVCCDAWLW